MKKNKTGVIALIFKLGSKILSVLAKASKAILVGVSFAAYAYMYTWQFAVIILSMLIVHEYGHIWAMQRCGIKTKGIYLIPFVGGLAIGDGIAKSRRDEVFIALMGPVFGLGISAVTMTIYQVTGDPMYAAAASWMALVNIINLFPITPLDGGRVMKAVTLSLNSKVGLVYMSLAVIALILGVIFLGWWTFLVLAIIGALELALEFYTVINRKKIEYIENNLHLVEADKMEEILELIANNKDTVVRMDWRMCVVSMLCYFAVLVALYEVMVMTINEPGAAAAMEMLK